MLPIRRLLAPLIVVLALAAGCAELSPPPSHGPIKATTGGAFETQTLYSCTGSTGSQVVFAKPKSVVNVLVKTGVIWVKPHSGQDTSGSVPTTPIPSANSVANGWVRLNDGEGASWGIEQASSVQGAGTIDAVGFLDVWCETQGDLRVVAH